MRSVPQPHGRHGYYHTRLPECSVISRTAEADRAETTEPTSENPALTVVVDKIVMTYEYYFTIALDSIV